MPVIIVISANFTKIIKNINYILYLLNNHIAVFEKKLKYIGFNLYFMLSKYRLYPIIIYR
jgi:hypothetical protein